MRTIRHLIYGEVIRAVAFVMLAFLALFFFFDLVDQLDDVARYAKAGYTLPYALLYVALLIPSHVYELLPIAVLIGTIYVMARLAESSEFTILRTSGLGPRRALTTLLALGVGFVALTFVFGDYLTPEANRTAQLLRTRFWGELSVGQTGAWLKDRQPQASYSVNVGAMSADGAMSNVRIFEFDDQGRLLATIKAGKATFGRNNAWELKDVKQRQFGEGTAAGERPEISSKSLPEMSWPTQLSNDMVAAALLSPDRMKTVDLFQYIRHLQTNGQSAQRYEIEFWRKVFYPLSCLVMMVLALPFAYLHFRAGNITGYVFLGVLVGISFFLLNNVFGFVGNLRNWEPWLTAAAPGFLYSLLSLAAFGWLVLRQ
ncbi:LPS export ABC transporter permease LptG [Ottowia sp.]|uniref:LPS export ABC transporter permease LptG n=1 Tax=Ottowia sp. TaxID=1898956 RepID=UPI0026208C35|nr:LPS export ABC transporter permease LptG [Ottowia sp.]